PRRRRTAAAATPASRPGLRRQHRLQRARQLRLQRIASLLDPGDGKPVLGQQLVGIAMALAHGVRVLQVQVVAAAADLLHGYPPGLLALLAGVPPRLLGVELLDPDRPRLAVALLP